MTRTLLAALVTLGDPNRLTGGYLYHRRLADIAPRHGARIEFVSVPDRPFPLAVIDARATMRAVIRTRADVMVIDSIAAAFLGPWLTVRKPQLPVVGMLHQPPGGIDHGSFRTLFQAWLDRLAYRRAQRLFVASESLADELRRTGEPDSRIAIVPPGRDVAATLGKPPGDLRHGRRAAFLCVGNWVERKGILSLLDAFAMLRDDAASLHLVGDPNAEPKYGMEVRARLERPDLRQRVIVHGTLSVSEVAALYAAADAFVLPSLKEPYGTVYGEAMAFSLPVVGWRAGNLPYLAEHESEALLAPPGDVNALAEALRRLAEDAQLRARLGANARQRAETRPTWDEVTDAFVQLLRHVATQPQATSPV
jgi:glycosyltransferase involved in cell wall biosynthesis